MSQISPAINSPAKSDRTRRWTAEDDEMLRRHHGELTGQEIALMLGRTPQAVFTRASVLGLSNKQPWTDEDASVLWRLYSSAPMHELCAALNRTPIAIRVRASKLGLKREESPDIRERHRRHSEHMRRRAAAGARNSSLLPLGTTRPQGGKLFTKVADTGNPHVDWIRAQRVVWEAAHGPIPPGHLVTFKDRNPLNIALENLELISGTDHMARITIARYPRPYQRAAKALGQFLAKLKRLEKDREKSE